MTEGNGTLAAAAKEKLTVRMERILEQVNMLHAHMRTMEVNITQLTEDRDRWKHLAKRREETIALLNKRIKRMTEEGK